MSYTFRLVGVGPSTSAESVLSQPLLVQQHCTLETSGEHLTKPRVTRRNLWISPRTGPFKKMPIRGKSWIPHGSFNITIVSIPYIWYLTKLHVLLIVLHIHLQLTVWLKQCHKPPMTGTGLYNLFMVITRGWFMALFYQHDTCFVTHFTFLLWMVAKSGITDGWNPIPSGND